MNTKKSDFQISKKSFIALSIVMILNFVLGGFLIHNVLAQQTELVIKDQPPVKVEVESQKDSPLLITVFNVDNSDDIFQIVNYTIQNVSDKPIRSYTIVGRKIMSRTHINKLFESQKIITDQYWEEKINIKNLKNNEKITLFIDYVKFADGSSWGKDIHQTSERITQEFAGRKAAIDYFRDIIKNKDQAKLTNALETDISDYQVPYPDATLNENEKRGFRMGYKSVVSLLQEIKEQKIEKIIEKLGVMERAVNQGEK